MTTREVTVRVRYLNESSAADWAELRGRIVALCDDYMDTLMPVVYTAVYDEKEAS